MYGEWGGNRCAGNQRGNVGNLGGNAKNVENQDGNARNQGGNLSKAVEMT